MVAIPSAPDAGSAQFSHTIVVSDEAIDALGHASNIEYVRWIQDAALAHSTAVGLDVETYQGLGGIFVVRRQEIDYLRPVLRGEQLQVRTWLDGVFAAKSLRATEITRVDDGKMVARSMTTWGFIEIATGRPTRIPLSIRDAFGVPQRPSVPPASA